MSAKKYGFDWVLNLPQVDPDTTERHSRLRELVEQAEELEAQVERLKQQAHDIRAKAYRDSLALESHCRSIWPAATVERLKHES